MYAAYLDIPGTINKCVTCIYTLGCPSPKCLTDGKYEFVKGNRTIGSVVKYECKSGYKLKGTAQSTCQASLQWSNQDQVCEILKCAPPKNITNGYYVSLKGNNEYGAVIRYKCIIGYAIDGTAESVCQLNQKWTPNDQVCTAQLCVKPNDLTYGSYKTIKGNTTYGSVIKYECDVGYKLRGTAEATCQESQHWLPMNQFCEALTCQAPKKLNFGLYKFIKGSMIVGSVIKYECNLGYKLVGTAESTCKPNQQWSPSDQVCEALPCPPPKNLTNGNYKPVKENMVVGNVVKYECQEGYKLSGTEESTCLPIQQWSPKDQFCEALLCPSPKKINYGHYKFVKGSTAVGSIIKFDCHTGYKLKGTEEATCQPNQKWSSEDQSCEALLCPEPKKIPNGQHKLVKGKMEVGSVIKFECQQGYKLVGTLESLCQPNQQWSSPDQVCEALLCPPPKKIEYGQYKSVKGSRTIGSIIKYQCQLGFKFKGTEEATCQPNQNWSSTDQACEALLCPPPKKLMYGNYSSVKGNLTVGSVIKYECQLGYKLIGTEESTCQPIQQWSPVDQVCEALLCPSPKTLDYGGYKSTKGSISVGSTIKFQCDLGYKLKGSPEATCQQNQQWSSSDQACEAQSCPPPKTIKNGQYKSANGNMTIGAIISFECEKGYKLVGTNESVCQPNQEWSPRDQVCEALLCPPPKPTTFGEHKAVKGGSAVGSVIKFECQPGYKLVGVAEATCQPNQEWSQKDHVCEALLCPQPKKLMYGGYKSSKGTTAVGSVIKFECQLGYKLVGTPEATCKPDLQWSSNDQVCEALLCLPPKKLTNGGYKSKTGNMTVGSIIKFECELGYKLVGTAESTCQPNQQWSHTDQFCDALFCSSPKKIANGNYKSVKGNMEVGSIIKLECDLGYKLIGKAESTCQPNQQWSSTDQVCQALSCPAPKAPLYGKFVSVKGNMTVGSVIKFECEIGHKLLGTAESVCQPNLQWSRTDQVCEALLCPQPKKIQYGYYKTIKGSVAVGSIIKYVCDLGYKLKGVAESICQSSQKWSHTDQVCEALLCPAPRKITYGSYKITKGNLEIGSIIKYECESGYKLLGTPDSTCQTNQEWSHTDQVCEALLCPQPKKILYGFYKSIKGSLTVGSVIKYECQLGYKLVGTAESTCQPSQKWSHTDQACEEVSITLLVHFKRRWNIQLNYASHLHALLCPQPKKIDFGVYTTVKGTTTVGSIIKYECQSGYKLMGTAETICQPNQLWSHTDQVCEALLCPSPKKIAYGEFTFIKGNLTIGSVVKYTCTTGYIFKGTEESVCQPSLRWSPIDQFCEEKKQLPKPKPGYGYVPINID